MSIEGSKNIIPLGSRGELKPTAEFLPVREVKNKVLQVNPDFNGYLPFDFKVGQSTQLARFFSPTETGSQTEVAKFNYAIFTRAGMVGRFVFKDVQGRLYRDILAKGVGACKNATDTEPWQVVHTIKGGEHRDSRGICDIKDVEKDWELSALLAKHNAYIPKPIMYTELEEILNEKGEVISINEAKKLDILLPDEQPVVYLRAFGVETRFNHLSRANKDEKVALLEDARVYLAEQEKIIPEIFSYKKYLELLIERLAKNLKIFQELGLYHANLASGQNFTLDGSIVDFDTVRERPGNYIDQGNTHDSFKYFLQSIPEELVTRVEKQQFLFKLKNKLNENSI